MVVVPAGQFLMGSWSGERERWRDGREEPQHPVVFNAPFALGRFAVMVDQFETFVKATGHHIPDELRTYENHDWPTRKGLSFRNPGFDQKPRHPVVGVSWDDAVAYCKWLSTITGKYYRLSSEAEWEYACRAGTAMPFWWGESISTDQANYDGRRTYDGGGRGENREGTVPVDRFQPNAWGLYQTHGNAWEWCADNWHRNYRGAPQDGSVWQGGDKSLRVARGGSWIGSPTRLRSAARSEFRPGVRNNILGFRVARTITA